MADFHCPYCQSWEIFQSRFRWIDLLCLPLGHAHRCTACNERFYSWKKSPARHELTGLSQAELELEFGASKFD